MAALITGVMNAHSLVAPMLTPHPAKTLTNDPAPRQDRALTPAPGLILIQGHILVQGLTLAQGLGPLIAQGPTPVMTIAAAPSFEIQLTRPVRDNSRDRAVAFDAQAHNATLGTSVPSAADLLRNINGRSLN